MTDKELIEKVKAWSSKCGCVVGRREFSQNRYALYVVKKPEDVVLGFNKFVEDLKAKKVVACLFICPSTTTTQNSAYDEIRRLADLFTDFAGFSSEDLVNGKPLSKAIPVVCPVTNVEVLFPDFDGVAFCPQSGNIDDNLYDPLMATPIPAVNIASDIYAFSIYTRDTSLRQFKREIWELSNSDRVKLFETVVVNWQTMGEKTIKNYIEKTDTSRCPVYLSPENKYWYANHQDPAFAESVKALFRHDMPKVYAPKIVYEWEQYFSTGKIPVFKDTAVAGIPE